MENWKYPGMELINQKVDPTPSWINPSETFHSKSNHPPPFISRKAVSGEWSYVRIRTDLLRTIHDGYVRSCVYTRWLIHAISGASPHPRAIFKSRVFFSAAKPLAGVKRADNCLRRQSSARVGWGEGREKICWRMIHHRLSSFVSLGKKTQGENRVTRPSRGIDLPMNSN